MRPPEYLIDAIKKNNSFLILTHTTPDGDAFGSSIALKFLLEQFNKKAEIYAEYPIPVQYQFLPGSDSIKNIELLKVEDLVFSCNCAKENSLPFDILILVDCNNLSRISYKKEIIEKIKTFSGTKLIIDHHVESNLPDHNSLKWIDPQKAATGIMVFYLIKAFNGEITPQIATNLYTAIIVDTGNFQFENTTKEVLSIASELVSYGAKPSYIYQHSFESWSQNRFRLFIKMLNNIELFPPIAISFISKKDFDETLTQESDTERFVEFLRILKEVNITALFREIQEGFLKVSLRSKGDLDVSKIAEEFGGGGHKNAAGYRISASFEEARNKLIEKMKVYNMLK
ncbi:MULTISPECIES: DHH family phosphoesterase [Thermodesulfovibrio]|uniref:Exopolyphosphatase-related protein n=1 Tax=Thermodesulfovibrio yellowstonii (strain ATCC 51303 / DSM 11347 / YP87) TaxID=289376 RepID=B5YHU0_THEYD|nr:MULTISPECIES: bifunctional oligoribonuclease/PAP phosphatase NrnA [Thermodesulfovibrio]ACI21671.1 exopolyphosphatase-related protein [Thermodesulfovibrio yellowstonii DSM 11347]MDI6865864.1 bifunctional oligoribonuclease/PAP phosphatase NrnA [Thermodesulfovibrio yellowstonii]